MPYNPNFTPHECGARIREARDRAGLTQEELAEKLAVHKMTVSKWERGEREPKGPALLALGRELKVSPAWILGYQDAVSELALTLAGNSVEVIASAILVVDRMAAALESGGTPLNLESRAHLVAKLLKLCESSGKVPSEISAGQLLAG